MTDDPFKLTPEAVKVARDIGQFFLEKNGGNYDKTRDELQRLQIAKLEVGDGRVTVYTSRPGVVIGVRGRTVDELSKYLDAKIRIVEVSSVLDWMMPEEEDPNDLGYDLPDAYKDEG